ncbi:GNAT family N-acetyltransferase [Chryseolinea lacunae]|uniref:GNAT family N-acetyltransferase n=1 Tax=Chryseolinea lacunae TaxID=2801331 RepID=A0ABS1KL90_9BACT|nr:GNAT family N-acetyltransferase [Chryseolinea lacunae]MBL0740007.1 GNAT family N-acetyltransferase [Chryseolinea lacunae]
MITLEQYAANQPFGFRRVAFENGLVLAGRNAPWTWIELWYECCLEGIQHLTITEFMEDDDRQFVIEIATENHTHLAAQIAATMEESAATRGTGIGKRSPETIAAHMLAGNALVALHTDGRWAGFCYMNTFDNGAFVSNSGLIVAPDFRDHGLAKKLKQALFELCRKKYPEAHIIGITTSVAVMKINTELGFYPTVFSEMPRDEKFWKGCELCVNHDILKRTGRKFCLCTAMRYDVKPEKIS